MKSNTESKALASEENEEVVTLGHIIDMVKSILSACVQKGADSVSKDEIKQFRNYRLIGE